MRKPAWTVDARTGPVRYFGKLAIFACEGLICIIDERPGPQYGDVTMVTPAELQERLVAINRLYRNQTRAQRPVFQREAMDRERRGTEACLECIREAKEMGDPSDPRVQAYWARHRRRSSVLLGGSDLSGYPRLPDIVSGKHVWNPTPDLAQSQVIRRKPRRKRRGS